MQLRFLLGATLLHMTIPVAAAVVPARPPVRSLRVESRPLAAEIDVDVALPEPRAEPPDPALPLDITSVPPSEPLPPSAEPPPDEPASSATELVEEPPPLVADGPREPRPGPSEYDRPPEGLGRGIPGLDGVPVYLRPDAAAPERPETAAAPTAVPRRPVDTESAAVAIQGAIHARDAKLGLDLPAASAIASVVRATVRGSDAPYFSSASFVVTLDASGKVSAVSLAGFSGGDGTTWDGVRQSVLAQLSARTFPLKQSFPKGAVVSVAVRSELRNAGGGTARKGLTMSFDATDAVAGSRRVVAVSFAAQPIR
jgi:hypothetical protein